MTTIRLTNPNSYVQVVLYSFGTYEEAAKATGTTPSTIKQWRTMDKVPNKHLGTLASKAGIDPIKLWSYCKDKEFTKARVKSASVIDALITGEAHPEVDETRRKQLLTLWGDRLTVLKEVFEALQQPFEDQKAYGQAVAASASKLGVGKTQIYRLMRLFSVKRKALKVTKAREDKSKEAKNHAKICENAAISAIKGQSPVVKLAEEAGISPRQLFRYVDRALANYKGVTLQVLTRYPGFFRMAVAHEIVHRDHNLTSMKLRAIYDDFPPRPGYRAPKTLKRASYKDKLIAVLSAEITLHDLAALADTPEHVIEEAFDRYCVPFGLSWTALRSQSVYHQAFFAEILKGSGHGI